MTRRDFLFWLLFIPAIGIRGRVKVWQYLESHLDASLPLSAATLTKLVGHPVEVPKDIQSIVEAYSGWPFVTISDEAYPSLLREISVPPIVLFYLGDLSLCQLPTLGVVGAREMSRYGEGILKSWTPIIAALSIAIVSGLAKGVDGYAHELALSNSGPTIAVIGTGIDMTYPHRVTNLQTRIAKHGLLLSEYLPGTSPAKHHFPERNRIIAGLSQAVLVVEAKKRSGSLITAQIAIDENREVLAVPGRIDEGKSAGANELISQGAVPALTVETVVATVLG
jgi:DNA processing protein